MRRYLLLLALTAVAACGDNGGGEAAACSPAVRERVDPGSSVHVLVNAEEPEYLSDPPTSGPHLAGAVPTGALQEPLARPAQVTLLEAGKVLVQHAGLDDDDVAQLEALVGDGVVVAPNDTLDESVVATAWAAKLTCDGVDVIAVENFVAEWGGRIPEVPTG